jgi:two-component system sensor histidine kinase DegS
MHRALNMRSNLLRDCLRGKVGLYPIDFDHALWDIHPWCAAQTVRRSSPRPHTAFVLNSNPSFSTRREPHRLSGRYQSELRNHLRGRPHKTTRQAGSLGKNAISQGLGTLDLAHMHGLALLALMPANCSTTARKKTVKRAGIFFLDALAPIEKTRRAAVENIDELKRSNVSLRRRTIQLTAANQNLKIQVAQREAAERALRQSERNYRVLLTGARRMQHRLRHLSHQVLSAQEKERKEISRELHDEIVQTLTGINVQLASLKIESGVSKESFSKHISYTQRLVEKSVDIVHRFARDLRPTLLDDLGLIPALHAFMKGFTKRTGLQVGFTAFSGVERLSNDKRTVLYRVAQAALVNIGQHAKASTVSVTIKDLEDAVRMEIRDDGKSFNVARVLDSRKNKRLGLIGMRERVEMVGGVFRVDSAPGLGTTVSATVPYKRGKIK